MGPEKNDEQVLKKTEALRRKMAATDQTQNVLKPAENDIPGSSPIPETLSFGGWFSTGSSERYVAPNLIPKPSVNYSTEYRFSNLVNIPLLQQLLNSFYLMTGIPHGLIDVENNVLSGIGWQDICTQFHRVCPGTLQRCQQSDSYIAEHLLESAYVGYRCLNGLMDYGTPIIIEGRHLATIFLGQFFHAPPDEEFFRQQAQEYSFDEVAYMQALRRVPIISEDKIKPIMEFYSQLGQLLAIMGLDKMRLKESEDKYRTVFENTGTMMAVVEEDLTISLANAEAEKLTGYSREEVEGKKKWTDFVAPDDLERMEEYFRLRRIDPAGMPTVYEFKLINKQGAVRNISAVVSMLPGTKKSIAALLDITERKQAEEELRLTSLYNRSLIEASLDPLVTIGFDGRITDVNNATEIITGYSRDKLIGTDFSDYFTDPQKARHGYQQVFKDGLVRDYPLEIQRWDGQVTPVLYHASVYRDKSGNIVGIFAAARDITQRKEAERNIQEANVKLSRSVMELEERTTEMSQLSEMGEQLQSCQTIEEACAISAPHIQKLFPASQGAIYLISPVQDFAEAIEMWGDSNSMEKVFIPSNCWAIRRCRPHLVDDSHPGLLCGHITGSLAGPYLCVPMMAQGEVLGIQHLNHPAPEQDQLKTTDRLFSEHQTQLALTVAEHLSLSLSNLRLQETLRQQAIRDILTGLFNRRYLEESLTRELRRAEREKEPVGVIMFDIDHFKDFNDLFGHDGGDVLLRELGGFLIKSTRGGDIVARYGGEEFIAVLPGSTLADTLLRAEELRQGVKELQVFCLGKPLSKCTLSFGVAAFPEHGWTSDEILKSADTALYRAKSEGRDRVVVAATIG